MTSENQRDRATGNPEAKNPTRSYLNIACIILAIVGATLLSLAFFPVKSGTRLDEALLVSPSQLEVGPEKVGDTLRAIEVSLKNNGNETIVIKDLDSTCGCTQLSLLKTDKIAPGDTLIITGKVNLPFVKEKIAAIEIVYGFRDENRNMVIPIRIKPRRVERSFIADKPSTIRLSGSSPEGTVKQTFEIKLVEPPETEKSLLKEITSTVPNVEVQVLDEETRQLNSLQVERKVSCELMAIIPASDTKPLLGDIQFWRENGEQFKERISLRVELKRNIRFIPEEILFNLSDNLPPSPKRVLMVSEKEFAIQDIKSTQPWLQNSLSGEDASKKKVREIEISVTDLDDAVTADTNGELVVTSHDFPDEEFSLSVKVLGK